VRQIDQMLEAVGPRLRSLRRGRGITLAQLSAMTGISVSTLSRLESGQRRATLDLLLPIARAYHVPLDEVVPLPADDPRIHPRPIRRDGMTLYPLTRRSSGLHAYKIVIPPSGRPRIPDAQTHEGYEWLYVLSGRLRVVLGEHEFVMGAGEAAEFDTRVPHWFGTAGTDVVEFLSLFGPQGERFHVRARPARTASRATIRADR
jgi:transcriptional regulator with XRE-family HTH domain